MQPEAPGVRDDLPYDGGAMNRSMLRITLALLALTFGSRAEAQLPAVQRLTLEASREIVAAAEETARTNGWEVVIVVVDEGGHVYAPVERAAYIRS
jgi:hypothetical protein